MPENYFSLIENQFGRVILGFVPSGLIIDVICVVPDAFMLVSKGPTLISQHNANHTLLVKHFWHTNHYIMLKFT